MTKLAFIITYASQSFMPNQCREIITAYGIDVYLWKGSSWINYQTGVANKGYEIFANYDAIAVCESMICYQPEIIEAKRATKKNKMLLFPHSLLGTAYDIGCSTHRKIRDIEGVYGIVPKDWLKFSSMDRVIGGNPSKFIKDRCFVTNTIPMLSNVFSDAPSSRDLKDLTCGIISLEGPYDNLNGLVQCAKMHPRTEERFVELFKKNNPEVFIIPKNYENKYRICNSYKRYIISHSSMIVELSLRAKAFDLDQELAVTKDAYHQTAFLDFEFEFNEGVDTSKRIFFKDIKSVISKFRDCRHIADYYQNMFEHRNEAVAEFGEVLNSL